MNTRIIPVQVRQEYVRGAGVPVGAAGSHNDVVLELEFSPLWDGLAKTITWLDARKENPVLTILTANLLVPGTTNVYLVPIPAGPKRYAGEMTLSVKGAAVENGVETRATLSVSCTFPVLPSDYDEDAEEAGDISATQAQQLQAQVDTMIDTIADAVLAAEDAEDAQAGAQTARDAARESALAAEESAEDAATSATIAAQSAETAKQYSGNPAVARDGTWWIWNAGTGQYEDSGVSAVGPQGDTGPAGPQGETGPQGPKGDTAFATDENSGRLVRVWYGTVAQYNALATVDPDVYYYLLEGSP